MTPTDDAAKSPGRGGSDADRRLILGALEQADRMVMSSVEAAGVDPGDATAADRPDASAGRGTPVAAGAPILAAAGRARSRAVDLPPGFFPGYDVIREVHRGGQGVVFEAIHRAEDRRVAIKLLHGGATSDGSAISRFEREVAVLQGLDDPGIVRVHGSGRTADGGFYYVMDYIAGEPLDVLVRRLRTGLAEAEPWVDTRSRCTLFARSMTGLRGRGRRGPARLDPDADPESRFVDLPSRSAAATSGRASQSGSGRTRSRRSSVRSAADPELRRLLELFADICDAVAAAHMRGVIHRDLKPANIRLDERGRPILVDFGLAKIDAGDGEQAEIEYTQMTRTGQFVGSMPWSSPEQAAGEHRSVDIRSDVYSLGVILYQLVTGGKFPYKVVGSMREVLDAILYAEPIHPSAWGQRVGDELETIVLKALQKPRDRRYQSAGELGRDVRRYLAGEPIEAKRDSALYVLSKTIQRHKAPTGIAATGLAAAVVLSIVLGPLYLRANAALDQASTSYARELAAHGHVRDLVRTMLYDFHEKIRNLNGATAAREVLLQNALTYLELLNDQLVDDAGVGPRQWGLVGELADAHDQVGVLMSGVYVANTGDTESAGVHFAESRRLREAILAADPANPAVLIGLGDNAANTARWLQRTGRFDEAIEAAIEARSRFDRALELDPDSVFARKGLANVLSTEADQQRRLIASAATLSEARDHARRALALYGRVTVTAEPLKTRDVEAFGRFASTADLNAGLARNALALRLQDRARTLSKAESGEEPIDAALAAHLFAEASELRQSALVDLDAALDDLIRFAQARPGSQVLQRNVVIAHYSVGLAHERIADAADDADTAAEHRVAATETYAIGLELATELASDPSDVEAQRDVGLFLMRMASVATDAGQFADAEGYALAAADVRERIYRIDPAERHARDLAVVEFRLAEIAKQRAESGPEPDATFLRSALDWYVASRERFQGLADRGVPAATEIAELDGLIARIEGQLAEAR